MKSSYVIGVDFGTDSVRSLLIDTANGREISQSVHYYSRWKAGLYCRPAAKQFRQHPLDYLEGLEATIRQCLAKAPGIDPGQVKGIGIDTTGSTPVAVDERGIPLALLPGMEENPNAMFVLWKDHTAIAEAEEINRVARNWGGEDYTKYEGGIYSSEWFWAKILHIIRRDAEVAKAAWSWMEHCDWIPALLTGCESAAAVRRSRCAAGHKAMWHEDWQGLPPAEFLGLLDPRLADLRERLFRHTYTADQPAGTLSAEWAARLGLGPGTTVAVGAFDAHAGAVGADIQPYSLVKVMGTSTCDMLVAPFEEIGDKLVRGICGQVDGSIIPGMLGLEAGQSAFGDLLAWFRDLLAWPIRNSSLLEEATKEQLIDELIDRLSAAAEALPPNPEGIVALDWVNGRRTPDANQALQGAITGLNMGSDAPAVFRALVEAICFGSRRIVDRFEEEGIPIRQVIGLGGVAKKSPFVMQTLADVLNRPIHIAASDQAPALGAGMLAAVAAGVYPGVREAVQAMSNGIDRSFEPDPVRAEQYEELYKRYIRLGKREEEEG